MTFFSRSFVQLSNRYILAVFLIAIKFFIINLYGAVISLLVS